ncbi:hypothetical protein [Chitinophaga sp. XS-30]|uniref:hypothetical protein n=1 Tax=Chitinophaga sp. XS-30 TaxID=2604421 RepID=UPI0011DCF358|nr:hypothetical protein [Chitinophaga sp. XS-30]QEH41119.1 hypothetical protein FW415_09625 [Chitinophaga sp. XS-30]
MPTLHVRKIKGDRISMPEKEFKKLLAKAEELEDIKAFDKAMKKINAGKAELVPLEQVLKDMPKR